ncbi:hypothetical protein C8Q80DRAFT_1274789 [Daedaleopsis nitida]|nr:hypothetical protein C8Q80DRAFT_1274789 [Daedaleopsis nitida]
MPNPQGRNQYGANNYLTDEQLRSAFLQFAKENNGSGLKDHEQIARLAAMGLTVGRTTLYKIRKQLGIPSVRKLGITGQDLVQAVVDLKEDDARGLWGVGQLRQRLANVNVLIPRDNLRAICHDHFDHEFNGRFPGVSREELARSTLDCLGPFHQQHVDGHEKLTKFALRIGSVTLPIYGWKDQYSSFLLLLLTAPNIRLAAACGHFYLDFVETHGCIPITLVSDKGSEVGKMAEFQRRLRADAAPEFEEDQWPSHTSVRSVHNTPIEAFWHWFREGEGLNLFAVIKGGASQHFVEDNDVHVKVFNWLWPPLLQEHLDLFREYWNNHRIRTQSDKALPSGTSPRHMVLAPEAVRATAKDCSIKVRMELVHELREELNPEISRNEAYAFVDDEFQAMADAVYIAMGSPAITLSNAWDVFDRVVEGLSE